MGMEYHERWQDGYAFLDLQSRITKINKEREEVEKSRKFIAKRRNASEFYFSFFWPYLLKMKKYFLFGNNYRYLLLDKCNSF